MKSRATSLKITSISGHHSQPVFNRGRCEQHVRRGQVVHRHNSSPAICNIHTYRDDAFREFLVNGIEPNLDRMSLLNIPPAQVLNTLTNFTNRNHAQSPQTRIMAHRPSQHPTVRSVTFPQFGYEICIEKIAHQNSISRRFHSGRSVPNSKSGAILPSSMMCSNKLGFFAFLVTAGASASCKIRRCSSSAEMPCSAARIFSFFASSSGMFLTNN